MTDMKPKTRPSTNAMSSTSKVPPGKMAETYNLHLQKGENAPQKEADLRLGEYIAPTFATLKFARGTVGEVSLENAMLSIINSAERVVTQNNLASVEGMLVAQAYSLNLIFSECVRKSALNAGEYFEASQRYFSMALKAQNQCRMTLETLSAIKNPPVIYAKQANIANGPQQVNNGGAPSAHANEKDSVPNKVLELETKEANISPGFKARTGAYIPSKTRFVAKHGVLNPTKNRFGARHEQGMDDTT